MVTLTELTELAELALEPALVPTGLPLPGGVDPLGLRQINFDLMDQVFPGPNNVVRHIRPFTVVAWAWHRAAVIADRAGQKRASVPVLKDFVERIEVIYVWSQLLRDRNSALPGRDVLVPLLQAQEYRFGGVEWERRKAARTNSTALSAPINYGPALKAFGWLQPAEDGSGALVATSAIKGALSALDDAMAEFLEHPAFSSFGKVTVSSDDVTLWADAWALDDPSAEECKAMAVSLVGETAPKCRRDAAGLVAAAWEHLDENSSEEDLRRIMCGRPSNFSPPEALVPIAKAWRTLQNRQAFRLALESLFYWACDQVNEQSKTTSMIVAAFLAAAGNADSAGQWFEQVRQGGVAGPVEWMERLDLCLNDSENWADLPAVIRGTLAACIGEAVDETETQSPDRLPLARAYEETIGWQKEPVADFLAHIFDSWVFGQHVYWSVGRGLADARARGKTILRLKVVLEDDGWTMTPGAVASAPRATPDRLGTMVSLMQESGLLDGGD